MARSYDVIVLGAGGVGSAAAYHLARRGVRVLSLDRFAPGHDRGSSHGQTRVIRQAYFEHPDYVPLLLRAYELWRELEQEAGEKLLHQVGLLQVGPPEGIVVRGVLESARRHGLAVETLAADDVSRRFPALRAPHGCVGVYEPAAGYLRVEACVLAHLRVAERHGAVLVSGQRVVSFRADGSGVEVVTEVDRYQGNRLVIAPGPYAPQLLPKLGVPLVVRRKHVYWLTAAQPKVWDERVCPTYLFELPQGVFYGFPLAGGGVKMAEHSGGAEVADPAADPRDPDEADYARVLVFARQCLAGVGEPLVSRSVCYYTMSPDEHFLVDRLPGHDRVWFAAGLSGHGFKFTSVLGEALADLALAGRTALPVGFLSLARMTG